MATNYSLLICSYCHLKHLSKFPRVKIGGVSALRVDKLTDEVYFYGMTEHSDGLACVANEHHFHAFDLAEMTVETSVFDKSLGNYNAVLRRGSITIGFWFGDKPQILFEKQKIGSLEVWGYDSRNCTDWWKRGYLVQDSKDSFYYKTLDGGLVKYKWTDIETRVFDLYEMVVNSIQTFLVRNTLAYITDEGHLFVESKAAVDLNVRRPTTIEWMAIEQAGSFSFCTGQVSEREFIVVSVFRGSQIKDKKSVSVAETEILFPGYKGLRSEVFNLKATSLSNGQTSLLVVRRDGTCHLFAVSARGQLQERSRMCSRSLSEAEQIKVVNSVVATKRRGQFMLLGEKRFAMVYLLAY